jgi:hypothetical protein
MKVSISGLLESVDRRVILGGDEECEARFRAARVHQRWVRVKVDITPHQADELVALVGAGQAYEYVFYDAVMEVWDHTNQTPRLVANTFEDQTGRVLK